MTRWTTNTEEIPGGRRFELMETGGDPLDRGRELELLGTSSEYRRWLTDLVVGFPSEAVYWEKPPLRRGELDRPAEMVLLGAPALARLSADPTAFREHFEARPGESVVAFDNLGGDARLVVPSPSGGRGFAHLASFLRGAPREQVDELWRRTASEVLASISPSPLWLGTAGLGVPWVHVRLDSRPKYTRYGPYRRPSPSR